MNYAHLHRQRAKRKQIAKETARAAKVAASRTCGECTLCCTVLGVAELKKPPGVSCTKLLTIEDGPPKESIFPKGSIGCSIYGNHPASCKAYACLWRTGGIEDEFMRPDRIGVIFDQVYREALDGEGPSVATRYKAINAREAYEGASNEGWGRKAIQILSQFRPIIVIGPDGKSRTLSGQSETLGAMCKDVGIKFEDLQSGKVVLVD